jgi:AraC-like DNA-binding protein
MNTTELLPLALRRAGSPASSAGTASPLVVVAARPTPLEATVYEPVMCLILQGAKETTSRQGAIRLRSGDCLLVSHDTPVVARITEASPDQPYVAVIIPIDTAILRGLYAALGDRVPNGDRQGAVNTGRVDPPMLATLARTLALEPGTVEADVLAPLLSKELHFRLLVSPMGGTLRQLLSPSSHANKIARAIAEIRRQYAMALHLPDLARVAGMSPSSFHSHFKAITGTTPLQYQKDLRLTEAKRLLEGGTTSVTQAGLAVGYESGPQFSREYARKFSVPPKHDLARRLPTPSLRDRPTDAARP